MAGEKKAKKPAKRKPNKQHDVRAASLIRMAKDARERSSLLMNVEGSDDEDKHAARSLREFADIHDREAKRLRRMR